MLRLPMGSTGGPAGADRSLSHFPNLEPELELLRSGRNADLIESIWMPIGPGCARPRNLYCRLLFCWLLATLVMT
jgi:hypothetical protein